MKNKDRVRRETAVGIDNILRSAIRVLSPARLEVELIDKACKIKLLARFIKIENDLIELRWEIRERGGLPN